MPIFDRSRWARHALTLAFALMSACGDTPSSNEGGSDGSGGQAGPGQTGTTMPGGGMATGAGGSGGSGQSAGRGGIGTTGGNHGSGGANATDAGNGNGNAGSGGAASAANDARTQDPGAGPTLVWPNDDSRANSDDWLVQHHDEIQQLRPRVLVVDLENTANAADLVQRHIDALAYSSSFHKYKDADAQPALQYELVKIVQASKGGSIDYDSWNTQSFADDNIQLKDPADDSGPNLTLCQLFERGVINEVWCMASSDPKCGETQESKQVYSDADPPQKMAGKFKHASNGADITGLGCKVTVRITDFNSGRGTGCHQHALGHGWERYMDSQAIPLLRKQAARFLNWDLDARVGAPFSNFYGACSSNGSRLTDCMIWDSEIAMHSGPTADQQFALGDLSGGCGNAHFYPNTTGTYSYDADDPDPKVLCSCEHYGMHDGDDGADATNEFTNAMTDDLYGRSPNPINGACPATATPACSDDCGGHGTAYLYQSFPGPGTQAKNDDGTPMHNWWVYLFY